MLDIYLTQSCLFDCYGSRMTLRGFCQGIAIFTSRHITQRVGRTNHIATLSSDWVDMLDDLIAKPALVQCHGQSCY